MNALVSGILFHSVAVGPNETWRIHRSVWAASYFVQ